MSGELAEIARTTSAVVAACEGQKARTVLRAFAEAGLLGAGAPETMGGFGLPIAFDAAIVDAVAGVRMQDAIMEALLAARHCPKIEQGRAAISGEAMITGALTSDLTATAFENGFEVFGAVAAVSFGALADYMLAPMWVAGQEVLALIDLGAHGVRRTPHDGFDAQFGSAHIVVDGLKLPSTHVASTNAMLAFRDDYRLLAARWLLRQAEVCLADTATFVTERRQFGQSLAAFQSVRFALANVAKELNGLALLACPWGARSDWCAAYAYASTVVPTSIEKCMHLHGGMGYTEEVPLHVHLRRARARLMAGDGSAASMSIAQSVMASVVSVGVSIGGCL